MRKFAKLAFQYAGGQFIFDARVKTTKISKRVKTSSVEQVINMPNVWGIDVAGDLACEMIRAGGMASYIVFKWVVIPRFSASRRPETKAVNNTKRELVQYISDKMGYGYTGVNFFGFRAAKREHSVNFESTLFSSKAVLDMDREQFTTMLQSLPSDARLRVKTRIFRDESKWVSKAGETLKSWYEHWENYKKSAQTEVRILQQQANDASTTQERDEAEAKLAIAKKEAKVNHGAKSTSNFFENWFAGKANDELALESFMDTVELPCNFLLCMDDSGSMNGLPSDMATFLATLFFRNNPDAASSDFMITFSNTARFFNKITHRSSGGRGLMGGGRVASANEALHSPSFSFMENWQRLREFYHAISVGSGTNVNSVARRIAQAIEQDEDVRDALMVYPVWLMVSDGNFNNGPSAGASLGEMLRTCEEKLGFRPYIVLMDVSKYGGQSAGKAQQFAGLENVSVMPPNPENLAMLLSNFNPTGVFDIYTPLQSIATTNRYQVVRDVFTK